MFNLDYLSQHNQYYTRILSSDIEVSNLRNTANGDMKILYPNTIILKLNS